jgi:hypothetical protein
MNTNSLYELFEIEYCARISKGRFLKSHIYSIFDVFARPKNVISKANVIHVKDVVHRIIERSEQKQFTTNSTNSNYVPINKCPKRVQKVYRVGWTVFSSSLVNC